MKRDIEEWTVDDEYFVETHSFSKMLENVKTQPYVTIVGVPGSGKRVTARHIALTLQKEGYDILPIKDIKDIESYCDLHKKQLFVVDDVLGVHGLIIEWLNVLDRYEDRIKYPRMSDTKLLMTCRETVFRNKKLFNSFLLKKENIIFLHSQENELNDQDKHKLLKSYKLSENLLTPENLASTSKMFPYLCKLYSTNPELRECGPDFFKFPVRYLSKELNRMQTKNEIHYALLVLLMANQNKLSKHMFEDNYSQNKFLEIKRDLLTQLDVPRSTEGFQFINALREMKGTYTKNQCEDLNCSCDCEFTFLSEPMLDLIAYHYGSQFPEFIFQYMSSDYIANKVKINKHDIINEELNQSDVENEKDAADMCIKLPKSQYKLLAERLLRDVKEGEVHNVFGNEALKHLPMLTTFIQLLEMKEYTELHSIFLSELPDTDKVLSLDFTHISKNTYSIRLAFINTCILMLLRNGKTEGKDERVSVRAISWVVYFGHHKILQNIINRTIKKYGNVCELFQNSYNKTDQRHIDPGAIESVTVEEFRLLCLGCASGDLDTVKTLLTHVSKEAINTRTPRFQYGKRFESMPLAIACYFENQNIVSELLIAGAEVNPTNSAKPPLIVACENGNSKVIEILTKGGAEINVKFDNGTPLTTAIEGRHLNVIDALIKARVDVNCHTLYGTPLTYACRNGELNIVKDLLNHGSDISPNRFLDNSTESESISNPRIEIFDSPLTAACRRGHVDVVQELITRGVDVNKDNSLVSPLAAACYGGHLSVIKTLLKAGADITETLNVNKVDHSVVFLKLVKLGINITKNDFDKTSFIAACARGELHVAEKMINEGADVNLKDGEKTPLIVACYFEHFNVVQGLIQKGARVDIGNGFITPLQVACYVGNLSIVSKLIEKGADVNLIYEDGTALAAACYFGHMDVVKGLIEAGADVNQKSHGETLIDIAQANSYYDMGVELIKAGSDIEPMRALFICTMSKTTKIDDTPENCL